MPSHDTGDVSGDGIVDLGAGFISPTELIVRVHDLGYASLLWQQPTGLGTLPGMTRVTHAGMVGFAFQGTSPTDATDVASWWTFIEFLTMDIPVSLPAGFTTSLFWHLGRGVVAQIVAFW